MTDNRTTELEIITEALTALASAISWTVPNSTPTVEHYLKDAWAAIDKLKEGVAATLGDEKPKKCCSTCQYRYVTGQRPYPTFGYMCGFGDGKGLCGDNRSVLDHMGCEHWEKELE